MVMILNEHYEPPKDFGDFGPIREAYTDDLWNCVSLIFWGIMLSSSVFIADYFLISSHIYAPCFGIALIVFVNCQLSSHRSK